MGSDKMKYYVVSDIHGYYDEMIKALTEKGFFAEKEPCKLIICGDLLDRGSQSKEIIDFILENLEQDKHYYYRKHTACKTEHTRCKTSCKERKETFQCRYLYCAGKTQIYHTVHNHYIAKTKFNPRW